jgi:hypothetical protein
MKIKYIKIIDVKKLLIILLSLEYFFGGIKINVKPNHTIKHTFIYLLNMNGNI